MRFLQINEQIMSTTPIHTDKLLSLILTTLDDHKAIDVKHFDVKHLTDVTDHVIVCTATSKRHALTLTDKVSTIAKQNGEKPLSSENDDSCEWMLIDFVDVVVHIMLANTREFYSIEKLWNMTESKRNEQQS